jgi:hypothetical protein
VVAVELAEAGEDTTNVPLKVTSEAPETVMVRPLYRKCGVDVVAVTVPETRAKDTIGVTGFRE